MKRISSRFFLLLVCAGLFFTHPLSAQQYHDAAAFGLEGNVKECKALNAKDGSGASDPYNFSELSFKRDGQLEFFTETSAYKKKRVYNHYRSNGMLTSFECDFDTEDSLYCRRFNFRYKGNQLFGYYCFSEEYHLKDNSYVPKEYAWGNAYYYKGDNSFTAKYFKILARNPHGLIYILEDEFAKGDDFLPNFQSTHPGRLRSETTNYIIAERDSHGNCTLLTNTDSGYSIKRIITYWDDTPNSDSSLEKAEVAKLIVEKTPGLKDPSLKELSISDLITRPYGVLSPNSRGISKEQAMFDLSDYRWKPELLFEDSQLSVTEVNGYDMSFLGVIPERAYAQFTKDNRLWCFVFSFKFSKYKDSVRFANRLISLMNSEGVIVPDYNNHDNGHARKMRFNDSIIYITMPDIYDIYRNKVKVSVFYRDSGKWIE